MDIVSISAAAAAIGLNKSTVSRFLKAHPELNRGSAAEPRVNVAELRQARERHVNAFMSANHAGLSAAEAMETPPPPASDFGERRSPTPVRLQAATARAAKDALNAQLLSMQVEERKGLLTDTHGAVNAALAAVAELTSQMTSRLQPLAEACAAKQDPVEIEALIADSDRVLLEAFAAMLDRLVPDAARAQPAAAE